MSDRYTAWRDRLKSFLEKCLSELDLHTPSVLEAGGGSGSFLERIDRDFRFTTIDISPEQLQRNIYAEEKICGDIETIALGNRKFNIIVAWDVLEHIPSPQAAIANLAPALAENGLMIIKGPIPKSMKGLVTKYTPHSVHVGFYRWVLGNKTAGKPGYGPFRTFLSSDASPQTLTEALRHEGLEIILLDEFEDEHIGRLRDFSSVAHMLFVATAHSIKALTGGRAGGVESDFFVVARRRPAEIRA